MLCHKCCCRTRGRFDTSPNVRAGCLPECSSVGARWCWVCARILLELRPVEDAQHDERIVAHLVAEAARRGEAQRPQLAACPNGGPTATGDWWAVHRLFSGDPDVLCRQNAPQTP